jgi:hypothetical protein
MDLSDSPYKLMDLQYILLRRKFVVVLEDMCNQPSLTKIHIYY